MKKKADLRIIIYIVLAAVLFLCVRNFSVITAAAATLWKVAYPLIMGLGIAYVINIVMTRVERLYFPRSRSRLIRRTRRAAGILVSFLLVLGVVVLILRLVLPQLFDAIQMIATALPQVFNQLSAWLTENDAAFSAQKLVELDWKELYMKVLEFARNGLGSFLNSTISVVGVMASGVINFVIALIFAIYILVSKEKLKAQLKKILRAYLSFGMIERLKVLYETANGTFSSFIIGQMTEAVILGSLCTVGMLIFRFPYATMIGAFIGATALIPVVGAYLGAGLGAFMMLTVDPMQALLFVLFIIVLQQLEGNIIYPRVVGSSIGLPGLWVLAAVTIGGGIGGIGGMLLGVPVAATVYKLLRRDVNRRHHTREIRSGRNTENGNGHQTAVQEGDIQETGD